MKQKLMIRMGGYPVTATIGKAAEVSQDPTDFIRKIDGFLPGDFGLLPAVTRFISNVDTQGRFYVIIEGKPVMRTISTYDKNNYSGHKAFIVPIPWHSWVFTFVINGATAQSVGPTLYFHHRQASSLTDYYSTSNFLGTSFLSNCAVNGHICWYPKGTVFKFGTDLDLWYKNLMNEFWAESFNSSSHEATDYYIQKHGVPIVDKGYNSRINSFLTWLSTKDLDFVLREEFILKLSSTYHPFNKISLDNPVLSLDSLFQAMR